MDIGWQAASAVAAGAAGLVATKVAEGTWKLFTGKSVPHEEDDNLSLKKMIVFAATSAVFVSLAQHYALKKTKKWYGGSKDMTDIIGS